MELALAVFSIILGFGLLIFGGDALVKAAISLAVRTQIAPAIISLTIVAAGTSIPELVTSLIAAIQSKPDIAVGNVVGSNIFNIFAILGISFFIKPSEKIFHRMNFEWTVLLVLTGLTYLFMRDFSLDRWEGTVLTVSFAAVIYISVARARKTSHTGDDEDLERLKNLLWDFGYIAMGLLMLVGGAQLALSGGVFLGHFFGLSEKVIGVTIIAAGTGLPELAASAVAAYRGRSDIAIGNVLGSNIMNTLAVLGGSSMIIPLSVNTQIFRVDFPILLLSILMIWPMIQGHKWSLGRTVGTIFFLLYVGYLAGTFYQWAFIPAF